MFYVGSVKQNLPHWLDRILKGHLKRNNLSHRTYFLMLFSKQCLTNELFLIGLTHLVKTSG